MQEEKKRLFLCMLFYECECNSFNITIMQYNLNTIANGINIGRKKNRKKHFYIQQRSRTLQPSI